jgi:ribosome-binding protein aMBF1 (putative translation factor)
MDHQDWQTVTLSNKKNDKEKKTRPNPNIPKQETKLVAPSNLGSLISQARTTCKKNRKELSMQLGISDQVLGRWESNKDTPNNNDIAKIEKVLRIKLPRCQRVKVEEN